ncbi:dihydrofolate reductase [Methanohalophilus levihalophilus]|uniref:dihydrofolate reductase family protein n=1 Tax=Methanohalophilus levihalophilus TaxID=1431282 RepID=UPI001AE5DC5D|nr:dihydrofolate reductase family protein [Methanohalophilus levihalophilus]MBP2031071.1 dihydrofolate reductase [Methanohalophilus levihalophilus]
MSRNIILYIAMSLDGYIARKNGDVDWLDGDGSEPNADIGYDEFYESVDAVIMGRKTYDQILTFGEYPYKGTKGYVYTSESRSNNEYVEFTIENAEDLVRELKNKDGKDIWLIGGTGVIDEFVKKDLIDEYFISIIPCVLGEGIPLFKDNNPEIKLKMLKTAVVNGIAMLHYVKS